MSEDFEFDLNKELTTAQDTNEDNNLRLLDSALSLPLRISCFHSEKEFDVFIKNIEYIIRRSIEYKLWVSYVTESLGHNKCVLSHEKMSECDLDVHHHPINLYTIVKSVVSDFLNREQEFSTFDISIKTIELHYQNKVGYIVLLSDLHKKFHNGFQKLPIDYVNGDYRYLLSHYNIDEEQRALIMEYCNTRISDCKIKWTKEEYPGLKEAVA